MYFSTIAILAISTASSLVAARPSADLAARQGNLEINVNACIDPDLQGECLISTPNPDDCVNLKAPFDNSISSITVSSGSTCILFEAADCDPKSEQQQINGGGIVADNLTNLNDRVSSFSCKNDF